MATDKKTIIHNFPEFRQTYAYDCGAEAVQSVLAFFGIDVREDIIFKTTKTTKQGTPVKGILKILKNHGIRYKAGKLNIKLLKNYIKKNIPVIIALQAWSNGQKIDWENNWNDGHYAVAIGYDKKNVYFEDPSSIWRTYLSYGELEKRWHDMDIYGKKYINYGIAVFGGKIYNKAEKLIHMD